MVVASRTRIIIGIVVEHFLDVFLNGGSGFQKWFASLYVFDSTQLALGRAGNVPVLDGAIYRVEFQAVGQWFHHGVAFL